MRYLVQFMFVLALGVVGCSDDQSGSETLEWAASISVKSEERPYEHFGFRIGIGNSANSDIDWLTDGKLDDYKPVYSADGSQIVFFRVTEYLGEPVPEWRSKICVMNEDGSGFRELTGGEYSDFVPYWTRDGRNEITFTRFALPLSQRIYRTSPDADPGEERLISDPNFFDFGYTTLSDGRMLVRRELPLGYFLLTPDSDGEPIYEELSYPVEDTYMHKMTVSPSETKVAYMKIEDITIAEIFTQDVYYPAVIAYADFDAANLRIENEVVISEIDESTIDWYPSWSPDEKHIIYAHSGVIMGYSLDTGVTTQLSSRDELNSRYPVFVGTAK